MAAKEKFNQKQNFLVANFMLTVVILFGECGAIKLLSGVDKFSSWLGRCNFKGES